MKKYNNVNYRWVLLGIVLPMIAFLLSSNFVYALFTASSASINSVQTSAIIRIGFSDDTKLNNVLISSASSSITDLVPGDDITITGKVVNTGNSALYFLLCFKLQIKKSGENTSQTLINKNYTISNGSTVEYNSTNNAAAASNTANEEIAFTLNHELSTSYGNEYQNAEITYTVTAYAVQQSTLTAIEAATYIATQMA